MTSETQTTVGGEWRMCSGRSRTARTFLSRTDTMCTYVTAALNGFVPLLALIQFGSEPDFARSAISWQDEMV